MAVPQKNPKKKIPLVLLVLLIPIGLAGIVMTYRSLTPDIIRGEVFDVAIAPMKDGGLRLWILCDDSFSYTQTTSTAGSHSISAECLFCTTTLYVYDPRAMTVVKKIVMEREDIAISMNVLYNKGRVWVIQGGYRGDGLRIDVYDADNMELVADTAAFVSKYPILQAGLVSVMFRSEDGLLTLKTKDGREGLLFDMEHELFYDDYTDLTRKLQKKTDIASTCILSPENYSGPRKRLFLVTGPSATLILNRSSLEMFADNANMHRMADRATARRPNDKIYLEGIIYHQDGDSALIIHQDQTGKKADRMLTCVDLKSGKEKWTVTHKELFEEMKIDEEDDSYSSVFFTKDNIKVLRSGSLVTLSLKGVGIMGFDFATGIKLWELEI